MLEPSQDPKNRLVTLPEAIHFLTEIEVGQAGRLVLEWRQGIRKDGAQGVPVPQSERPSSSLPEAMLLGRAPSSQQTLVPLKPHGQLQGGQGQDLVPGPS